ncbi:GNAT family N-acetyltransferase [Streptacidiphilus cavernicola]|uniref:GNAT family N-acetyltransferase n=1 Tax=Streptacidiphilus cavernicola TaxID=3342716 RepID=A0ABV6W042_9ACTN
MDRSSGLELANDNAARHWLAMAGIQGWETRTGPGYTAVRCEGDPGDSHRVVLTRRPADPVALSRELLTLFRDWETGSLCLEDPYAALDLSGHGCERALPMAVMVRPPGPVPERGPGTGVVRAAGERGGPASGAAVRAGGPGGTAVEAVEAVEAAKTAAGSSAAFEAAAEAAVGPVVEVFQARTEEDLAAAERVVVEGFPMPARMPLRRGRMFPASLDALEGRRLWLARRGGEPAGGCVSWDDGAAVGIYWVAVLERHRSYGVARAVLTEALRAHPDRAATLTATLLGEPLYRRLGFVEQGVTTWWRYPGTVVR